MSVVLRATMKVFAGLLILPLALLLVWGWSIYAYSNPFERVSLGDSEAQVLAACGRPDRITGAPENIASGDDRTLRPNNGQCVRVFWYIPPIAIEQYTVGFDSSAHVISKYRYSSP